MKLTENLPPPSRLRMARAVIWPKVCGKAERAVLYIGQIRQVVIQAIFNRKKLCVQSAMYRPALSLRLTQFHLKLMPYLIVSIRSGFPHAAHILRIASEARPSQTYFPSASPSGSTKACADYLSISIPPTLVGQDADFCNVPQESSNRHPKRQKARKPGFWQ